MNLDSLSNQFFLHQIIPRLKFLENGYCNVDTYLKAGTNSTNTCKLVRYSLQSTLDAF